MATVRAGLAAPAPSISNPMLIGTWSGEVMEGTSHRRWVLHLQADGRFHVDMRRYYHCHFGQMTSEAGTWAGDAHHFIVRVETIDGKPRADPPVPDVYDLIWLSRERMVYADVNNQTVYTAARVSEDYTFKGCYASPQGLHAIQGE